MTELIAIAALAVSILVLIIQYVNQKERRHGDIVVLRSEFLSRISTIQQRMSGCIMQTEAIRQELRLIPDSEDKFNTIESMPSLLEIMRKNFEKVKHIKSKVEVVETQKMNRSDVLLAFQSASHELSELENLLGNNENRILNLMEKIQKLQMRQKSDSGQPLAGENASRPTP